MYMHTEPVIHSPEREVQGVGEFLVCPFGG